MERRKEEEEEGVMKKIKKRIKFCDLEKSLNFLTFWPFTDEQ